MRIAVLIIGLLLGLLIFLQTAILGTLSSAVGEEATESAAAVGVLVALLWLIGSALVMPWPLFSVFAFAIAGLLGFAVSGDFPDMGVWGGISLVLAVMSFFGWRGKKKDAREKAEERQLQRDRDARLESLMQQQAQASHAQSSSVFCPSCGAANQASNRFCANCGTAVTGAGATGLQAT